MQTDGSRTPCRALLVEGQPVWAEAVRAALPCCRVEATDLPEALRRLVAGSEPFTHVLFAPPPQVDRAALSALLDLTLRDAAARTTLVALGEASGIPLASVARYPEPAELRAAIAAAPVRPEGLPPIEAAELREAIDELRIHARYQPVVRIADREPVFFEALARLDHPRRGMLLPGAFVPLMEDAGLAAALTERMASCAFADLATLPAGTLPRAVSLNFPLDVLLVPAALERLDALRMAAGLPAGAVTIELTESQPVNDARALARAVTAVRGQGYRLAIDDVGPETAQREALLGMDFTSVKLDQALVRGGRDDAGARRFADRLIREAHAAGMAVIAEGVEDAAAWARMREAGADLAQGFLIARALPVAALPIWQQLWAEAGAQAETQAQAPAQTSR